MDLSHHSIVLSSIPKLEALSKKNIMKNLGKLAQTISSRFSCGGTLTYGKTVRVVYSNNTGDVWNQIVFPIDKQGDMQQLLDACSIASFGIGSKQVTDQSYRDAFKLDSDLFATTFNLSDTPILDEIRSTMVPDVRDMRAEMYKLNVYGPGGHFKAHVDTPRSDRMFGSLVVCLPTKFSDGTLVTRHHGEEIGFDWSSTPDKPPQSVQWAAFFSDVEHEVLPVTSGYRVTLTYNLYRDCMPATTPILSVTNNPFYCELRAALGNPSLLREGGVLGFTAQHSYVFTDLNRSNDLPLLLKGADHIVYLVAKSLGLSVLVKPVMDYGLHDIRTGLLESFSTFAKYMQQVPTSGRGVFIIADREDEDITDTVESTFGKSLHCPDISWCQDRDLLQPAGVAVTFGNDACAMDVFYQAAAILVGVPKWGEKRRRYAESGPDTPMQFSSDEKEDQDLEKLCLIRMCESKQFYSPPTVCPSNRGYVRVGWKAPDISPENGYCIEYKCEGDSWADEERVTSTEEGIFRTFEAISLPKPTMKPVTYDLRVLACHAAGEIVYSPSVTFTTLI